MTQLIPARSFNHVETFQQGLGRICGRFNIAPPQRDGHLKGKLSLERLGGAEIAFVGLQAKEVIRNERDIKADPGNHFFLIIQDKGHALMRQGPRRTLLREGDMFLADATAPTMFEYQGRYSEQISLHLPRADMVSRFGERIFGGIDVKREDALSIAMRSVLKRMIDRSSSGNDHLVEAFLSIFGAFLVELNEGDRPQLGHSDTLIAEALREIAVCYKDPCFGPQQLAERLGVSLRMLQREFQQIDETPRRRILQIRLERAHDALLKQSHVSGRRTVSAIAFAQGFNDLSYFYREFRKRYGFAPGDMTGMSS